VSFLSFCAANVLIDVESLYNMVTHQPRVHTFLHTYIGATLAAGTIVLAFFVARRLLRDLPDLKILSWRRLRNSAVVAGALMGAWSHVLFDSLMHRDIRPWAPFSESNGLLLLIPLRLLHLGCLVAGVIAIAVWLVSLTRSVVR